MSLSPEQVERYKQDGYLVIEDHLSAQECDVLRERAFQIIEEADLSQHPTTTFTTVGNDKSIKTRSNYFITSGDKIRFFFEEGATDKDGKLKDLKPKESMNKIGHALHIFEPDFKKVTFSDKIKGIARSLGLVKPCIPQSMVIFKQPKIGGQVNPHQDSSFLNTTPMNLVGFWIALEDAEPDNACMWFAPGTHTSGISGQLVRTQENGTLETKFEGTPPTIEDEAFVCAPVRKGSLVLIHGEVVHKSPPNLSDRSRNIYTFHLYDAGTSEWSKDNWQQPSKEVPFPILYD